MVKVKDPVMSGQASGKFGGLVAARNRSGAYIRRNASPVQPRTPAQTRVRIAFVKVSNLFLNLDTTRQDQWNDFANNYTVPNTFGDAVNLTGLNWFIALNSRLDKSGFSLHFTPPINPEPSFTPLVSLSQDGAGFGIVAEFGEQISLSKSIWIYGTSALTRSRRFKSKSMRLLNVQGTLAASTKVTLVAASAMQFDNTSYQFETKSVDANGRATAPQRFTVFPTSV